MKTNKGITLIALVVTIVVLLILAGVSISMLTGENGIITQAQQSKLQTEIGKEKEYITLSVSAVKGEKISKGDTSEITSSELQIEMNKYTDEATVTGSGTLTVTYESGRSYEIAQDGNIDSETDTGDGGNTSPDGVTIPEGFVYVGGKKESGIVISDDSADKDKYKGEDIVGTDVQGNQYVWIPVDGILGENGKTVQDAINGEIILGRYVFNDDGTIDTNLTPTTLDGKLQTSKYLPDTYYYQEISTGMGNAVAKDINGFIDSVRQNGGYYIARFEASKGKDNKVESKYDKDGWNEISQSKASEYCQNLYGEAIHSDLINSYVWDTTILFIQKYGQKDYSQQEGKDSGWSENTGLSGDVQLNIYDISGNLSEWTTETHYYGTTPCTPRGGTCFQSPSYEASYRGGASTNMTWYGYSFRSILYL